MCPVNIIFYTSLLLFIHSWVRGIYILPTDMAVSPLKYILVSVLKYFLFLLKISVVDNVAYTAMLFQHAWKFPKQCIYYVLKCTLSLIVNVHFTLVYIFN